MDSVDLTAVNMDRQMLGGNGQAPMGDEVFDELQRRETELSFLAHASAILASSLDYETTLRAVAQLAVPHIADWCAVHILDTDGTVRELAVAHADPAKLELARELQRRYPPNPNEDTGVTKVVRTRQPEFWPEIPDEMLVAAARNEEHLALIRQLGLRSALVIPLVARGHAHGAITLVTGESGRRFDEGDRRLAQDLADRAALAIDNAHLYLQAEKLAAIVESSHDAIVGKMLEGTITSWNRAAQQLYGYSPEEIIGQSIDLLLPPDRAGEVSSMLKRVAQGERIENLETTRRRKDGQMVDVAVTVSPIIDRSGKVVGASTIARNISDQKRAEQTVRLANERFRKAFHSSPAALSITRLEDGLFLDVNDAFEALFGYSRDELLGSTPVKLNTYVNPSQRADIVRRVVEEGSVRNCEVTIRTKSGDVRELLSSFERIELDDKVCMLTTNVDITDRKRMEEEIRALNAGLEQRVQERTIQLEATIKELEAFTYSVSHDLRAPLRSLDGFSRILYDRYADVLDERAQRYLHHIRGAAQDMGNLIDALLRLARISRVQLHWESVDLSAMARDIVARLRETDPERPVALGIADGVTAAGDAQLLRIALENLFANAWKFTRGRDPAMLELSVAQSEAETVYAVRDNGAGFEMAYADKLFGPFQRLHAATEFEGLGIGLATVQRIIHRHGGKVWANGKPDEGATFFFTLPASGESDDGNR